MASSEIINELVWHFAGYLRVPPAENFTVKVLYEGRGEAVVGQDGDNAVAHPTHLPDTEPFFGAHLNVPVLPAFAGSPLIHVAPPRQFHDQHFNPHSTLLVPHQLPFLHGPGDGGGGGGGGGGGNFQITVEYGNGSYQDLIDVRQINALASDNQVNAPPGVVALNDQHATDLLNHMLDKAYDSVPNSLDLSSGDTTSDLTAFVNARDSHPLASQADDSPFATQPGQYVNGVPVTGGADPHQVTNNLFNNVSDALKQGFAGPPPGPTGDHQADSIQNVSVSSDIQANDAALTNLQGLSTMLTVAGNYYQTEAIVQTNVFAGQDHFYGGPGVTSIAANTVQNIADVENNVPTLTSGGSGTTPSGLNWSVDVVNGNFLDVHSLVQTNYLQNNNVVYQTSYSGDSQIIAGENTQTNVAQFQNLTANYQLIIVEGSYHQDDLIYQTNVLLDNNQVNFNGQGFASESATGGGNSAVNDATIVDTGNHNYQQFSSDAMAVVQALEGQSGTVDPSSVLNAFPSLFGNINVLVVTGDYYDVNYISQTNVMSNANVVQLTGSSTAPAGATQSVSTGHDITVNSASIVDGGSALSPYLQGHYYNDMILIQTNIIGNDPKVTGHDPSQLAPELVAFTGATEGANLGSETPVIAAATPQQHHDGMGCVLH